MRVNWLPFFLNPDTPAAGEPYREFLEAKFGGPIKAEAVLDKVRAVAADDGLQSTPSSASRPDPTPSPPTA